MMFHSIRWRLQAWHGVLLTAVVAGFGFTAHRLARAERLRIIDEELQTRAAQLSILPPSIAGNESRLPASVASLFGDTFYFVVWKPDGAVQASSGFVPADLTVPPHTPGQQTHGLRTRGTRREFYRFTQSNRCFLVGRPIDAELAALRRLAWYLTGVGAAVLAFGLLVGWWLATRALKPIAAISAAAETIAAGNLAQRISTAGSDDELNRLARVLNSTFARLETAFAQQARFTADAAHELRTPVAVILTHVQNALASDNLTDEHREAFQACQRAAQRMRRLIESLLKLARLDAGQEPMKRESFDLSQLTHDCVELVRPLANARGIALHCDLPTAPCTGDADLLAEVITNLLTNAIEYNRDHGEVRITARRANANVLLSVTDTGPGISAEDIPHIFERFYRADPSRTQTRDHTGLGLAISKAIVEAHGGTIEVASQPGAGATFTVRLIT